MPSYVTWPLWQSIRVNTAICDAIGQIGAVTRTVGAKRAYMYVIDDE